MDDTHIYEYDDRGEHPEDHGNGYDGYGDDKGYYQYEQQQHQQQQQRVGEDGRREDMW